MRLSKTFIVLLTIFAVVVSAGMVCAEENVGDVADPGVPYYEEGTTPSDDDLVPTDDAAVPTDDGNSTDEGDIADPGVPYHADGTNSTGNITNSTIGNATNATSGNVTNATNATVGHNLLSTGNPILILIAVLAVLGGGMVIRRK